MVMQIKLKCSCCKGGPFYEFFLKSKSRASCRCPVKVFHFYVVSALQFIVFVFFLADQSCYSICSSYVHQQHFRPRSLVQLSFSVLFGP